MIVSKLRAVIDIAWTLLVALAVEPCVRFASIPWTAARFRVPLSVDQPWAAPIREDLPSPVLPSWSRRPVRSVDVVARRGPFPDTCLRRALMLGFRLRRLDPSMRIGVRLNGTMMSAHAWVEIAGRSLDPTSPTYSTLSGVA